MTYNRNSFGFLALWCWRNGRCTKRRSIWEASHPVAHAGPGVVFDLHGLGHRQHKVSPFHSGGIPRHALRQTWRAERFDHPVRGFQTVWWLQLQGRVFLYVLDKLRDTLFDLFEEIGFLWFLANSDNRYCVPACG